MKIGVTGAGGFVGAALCPALARAGHDVILLDLRNGGLSEIAQCEAVVHLAAIAHRRASGTEIERVNVELTRQVALAARAVEADFLFVSSIKVHGETSVAPINEATPLAPRDPYGISKAKAEDSLRAIPGLRLAILRPPLVYGPGVKANFLALMRAIAYRMPLPLAGIENRRSIIYVGNLVDAIVRLLGREGTYVIADRPALSTPDLCYRIGSALGRPPKLFYMPAPLLPAPLAKSLEVDDTALRTALGWNPPYSLEAGLRETATWYRGR